MANNILTIGQITKTALAIFRNSNAFVSNVDRQYDDQFARTGGKIGSTLRVRLPNDYPLRTGPTAVAQSTNEGSIPLVVATQLGVDIAFSSAERTLSIDDYNDRYLAPMVNVLAGGVALAVMSGCESIPHIVHNVDTAAANNTVSPTAATWLSAKAKLTQNNAPMVGLAAVLDPLTEARTVTSLAGLFNSQAEIGRQYLSGDMRRALGMDWMTDNTVITHQTAAYGALPTVNGANQTGISITVTATTAPLKKGDIITFAGVNAVNRVNKNDIGTLRQFAITADVPVGATTLPIYPALTGQVNGADVAQQTVKASPANGAVIASPINAGEVYRKNIVMAKGAVTMVTADLELPGGVHEAARERLDDISMRMITFYNGQTDQMTTRLDVLFGYLWPRPEWAVVVADVV